MQKKEFYWSAPGTKAPCLDLFLEQSLFNVSNYSDVSLTVLEFFKAKNKKAKIVMKSGVLITPSPTALRDAVNK